MRLAKSKRSLLEKVELLELLANKDAYLYLSPLSTNSSIILITVYILQVALCYCGRSRKNKFVFGDLQKVTPDSVWWWLRRKLAQEAFLYHHWLGLTFRVIQSR